MDDNAYVERANALLREDAAADGANAETGDGLYSTADPSGYYARLGVSPKATAQEIRRAFLFLSQRYHTDKHANQDESIQSLMNDRFQQLQDAYTVLSDERQRAAYDAGGETGIKRLALVPVNVHKREDILNYVLSLNREAQLLQTSKMLSASSQTTMHFSTAHLFPFSPATAADDEDDDEASEAAGVGGSEEEADASAQGRSGEHADTAASSQPPATQSGAAAPQPPPAASPQGSHATVDQSASAKPTTAPTSSTAAASPGSPSSSAPPAPPASQSTGSTAHHHSNNAGAALQAQLTAKEVMIDGKRQVVLIPNQEVQQQLRQRMQAVAGPSAAGGDRASTSKSPATTASAASSSSSSSAAAGAVARRPAHPARRQLAPLQSFMLAAVPKSMSFRSSFQHMVTPRLGVVFRADAVSRLRRNTTTFTTSVEYQPDEVRSHATSLRFAVTGLKWCLMQRRELSPLWALKSKLTALTGAKLLDMLELTLIRKLSPSAELENALAMSLTHHGFFRSSINDYTENAQQGLSAFVGFHTLYFNAYTSGKVIFGVDTKDPKNPPPHGRVQYSINCSPLAGQTTLGIEAWYCPSKVQQYGLSFTTALPYSFSPIAPPLFLVESTQFAVINQISLLYARGPHRIAIPVIVFISPKVSQGLVWLSAPLTVYRIAAMLYRPYARSKATRYYTEQRKLHIAETDVAREKARLEQLALESLVLMSRASEERKGGLVIINARYGVIDPQFAEVTPPVTPVVTRSPSAMPTPSQSPQRRPRAKASSSSSSSSGNKSAAAAGWWPSQILARVAERLVNGWVRRRAAAAAAARGGSSPFDDNYASRHDPVRSDAIPLSIDVTIAVQNMVRDSALTLPAGSKSTLVGFCNPDPYTPEQKKLKIVYWFRKRKHIAIFDDDEEVELPQREHLIS